MAYPNPSLPQLLGCLVVLMDSTCIIILLWEVCNIIIHVYANKLQMLLPINEII